MRKYINVWFRILRSILYFGKLTRFVDAEDKKYEGNSRLEKEVFIIPYQESPFDLRKKLFEDLPKYNVLKERLRSA